ncbi:hypothetical protein GCM10011613_15710 [Cellvibrio zantedeschiae]|uniref:DUF6644 domain-containing protein n=1 Tax=Cellvibrio zantedeschiae TaxID=1237077 RepID=A0ABQ3AYE5_9GAMM|nr:DUF6644 family protein [Cellvibrio zantedeschiae]GGY71710.1 hypothetical protein GCM10011613_15710 [Cellvibrio zantedeschiae]
MTPTDLLQTMYESSLGTALSESLYVYPLVEGTHLLSLALSFGLILFTDLRLIGVFLRDVPVSQVLQQLRPILLIGFALTFASGILLTFAAGPGLLATPLFPLKVLFIFLAGLNALWFEIKFGRTVTQWGSELVFPTGAKIAGWISLISWTTVVILGRLIPYFDSTF